MRVFAVTKRVFVVHRYTKSSLCLAGKITENSGIVMRRTIFLNHFKKTRIIFHRRHDNHVGEVFSRTSYQRYAAYIYLFYYFGIRSAAGHRFFKRVQVNDNDIYFRNGILLHLSLVRGIFPAGQYAAEYLRVQSLNAPAEYGRIRSEILYRSYRYLKRFYEFLRAAGGVKFHPVFVQAAYYRF